MPQNNSLNNSGDRGSDLKHYAKIAGAIGALISGFAWSNRVGVKSGEKQGVEVGIIQGEQNITQKYELRFVQIESELKTLNRLPVAVASLSDVVSGLGLTIAKTGAKTDEQIKSLVKTVDRLRDDFNREGK